MKAESPSLRRSNRWQSILPRGILESSIVPSTWTRSIGESSPGRPKQHTGCGNHTRRSGAFLVAGDNIRGGDPRSGCETGGEVLSLGLGERDGRGRARTSDGRGG